MSLLDQNQNQNRNLFLKRSDQDESNLFYLRQGLKADELHHKEQSDMIDYYHENYPGVEPPIFGKEFHRYESNEEPGPEDDKDELKKREENDEIYNKDPLPDLHYDSPYIFADYEIDFQPEPGVYVYAYPSMYDGTPAEIGQNYQILSEEDEDDDSDEVDLARRALRKEAYERVLSTQPGEEDDDDDDDEGGELEGLKGYGAYARARWDVPGKKVVGSGLHFDDDDDDDQYGHYIGYDDDNDGDMGGSKKTSGPTEEDEETSTVEWLARNITLWDWVKYQYYESFIWQIPKYVYPMRYAYTKFIAKPIRYFYYSFVSPLLWYFPNLVHEALFPPLNLTRFVKPTNHALQRYAISWVFHWAAQIAKLLNFIGRGILNSIIGSITGSCHFLLLHPIGQATLVCAWLWFQYTSEFEEHAGEFFKTCSHFFIAAKEKLFGK